MARRRASELIMVVTAMNNELIMARRRASELIIAITAMHSRCLPIHETFLQKYYIRIYIYNLEIRLLILFWLLFFFWWAGGPKRLRSLHKPTLEQTTCCLDGAIRLLTFLSNYGYSFFCREHLTSIWKYRGAYTQQHLGSSLRIPISLPKYSPSCFAPKSSNGHSKPSNFLDLSGSDIFMNFGTGSGRNLGGAGGTRLGAPAQDPKSVPKYSPSRFAPKWSNGHSKLSNFLDFSGQRYFYELSDGIWEEPRRSWEHQARGSSSGSEIDPKSEQKRRFLPHLLCFSDAKWGLKWSQASPSNQVTIFFANFQPRAIRLLILLGY